MFAANGEYNMTGEIDPATQQPPMRRWVFVSSIIALVLLIVFTIAIIANNAIAQKVGPDGLFALLLFGAVALTASLATNEVIPWGARTLEHWLQPKVLAAVAMAILLATGTLFGLLSVLPNEMRAEAERASADQLNNIVENSSAARADAAALNNHLRIGETSLIAQHITGVWGDAGEGADRCAVTYRFTLGPTALTIDTAGNEALNIGPETLVYNRLNDSDTVTSSGPRQSTLTTEETDQGLTTPGPTVAFTLETNGQRQLDRLRWDHRLRDFPERTLVWCGDN